MGLVHSVARTRPHAQHAYYHLAGRPEDYPRPQFSGKECNFHVDVLSVKVKNLAELDDEFAKGVGEGFDTFDALLEQVRGRLTEESEVEATREIEMKSVEELVSIPCWNRFEEG